MGFLSPALNHYAQLHVPRRRRWAVWWPGDSKGEVVPLCVWGEEELILSFFFHQEEKLLELLTRGNSRKYFPSRIFLCKAIFFVCFCLLGIKLATQVKSLTRNQTGNTSVCGPALQPLNHTGQGFKAIFLILFLTLYALYLIRIKGAWYGCLFSNVHSITLPGVISTQVALFSPLREMAGLARKVAIRCLISSHSTSRHSYVHWNVFSEFWCWLVGYKKDSFLGKV